MLSGNGKMAERERWKNHHVKLCFLSNLNAYLTALWQIRTLEFLALPNVIKTIPMHFWETFENLQSPCYNQGLLRRVIYYLKWHNSMPLKANDKTKHLHLKDLSCLNEVPTVPFHGDVGIIFGCHCSYYGKQAISSKGLEHYREENSVRPDIPNHPWWFRQGVATL